MIVEKQVVVTEDNRSIASENPYGNYGKIKEVENYPDLQTPKIDPYTMKTPLQGQYQKPPQQ